MRREEIFWLNNQLHANFLLTAWYKASCLWLKGSTPLFSTLLIMLLVWEAKLPKIIRYERVPSRKLCYNKSSCLFFLCYFYRSLQHFYLLLNLLLKDLFNIWNLFLKLSLYFIILLDFCTWKLSGKSINLF